MAAVLEAAVSAKRTEIYLISADRNALMSRSEAVVENRDPTQMRDIFVQYPKRIGMRLKPENLGVGEFFVKINNGSTDVAADVENDFRPEGRRHIILCLLAAPEQYLIQNKWIGGTCSIKNVPAGPTQAGQR